MATRSKGRHAQILVEREEHEAVLAVISANSSVTIEALLDHLPWMRWGHLFSIIGECLREGSVILCQKNFQFEFRSIHSSPRGNGEDVPTAHVRSNPGGRLMAI